MFWESCDRTCSAASALPSRGWAESGRYSSTSESIPSRIIVAGMSLMFSLVSTVRVNCMTGIIGLSWGRPTRRWVLKYRFGSYGREFRCGNNSSKTTTNLSVTSLSLGAFFIKVFLTVMIHSNRRGHSAAEFPLSERNSGKMETSRSSWAARTPSLQFSKLRASSARWRSRWAELILREAVGSTRHPVDLFKVG